MTETESRWYKDPELMKAHGLSPKQELVDDYHPAPEDAEKIYRNVHAKEHDVNPDSLGELVWQPEEVAPSLEGEPK